MGSPKVSAEEWARRAFAINAKWLEIPKTSNCKGILRCKKCGYEWGATGNNIRNKQGCPKCAGNLPITAAEWQRRASLINAKWLCFPAHALAKAPLECLTCGYKWETTGANVTVGYGCHSCAGRAKVENGEWQTRAKAINAEWLTIPQSRHARGNLKCLICENEWSATGGSVSGGSGCPACANHGYSPNKPGALYVLDFGNGRIGYGISNFPDDRLNTHSKVIPFDTYRLWNFDDGRVPEKIEKSIKRKYATAFHVDLKIDGFRTEAIGDWPFAEFCKFVDMLIESEATHA